MIFCFLLFVLGVIGFVFNRTNIIFIILSIEIILLAITLFWVFSSINNDDLIGLIFSLFIITVAGAESALGLGLLVVYYRTHKTIYFEE